MNCFRSQLRALALTLAFMGGAFLVAPGDASAAGVISNI